MILEAAVALTILPGQGVGPVRATSSESELRRLLGSDRVRTAEIDGGEGNFVTGTLVDGDNPSASLAIIWRDAARRDAPERVFICHGSSDKPCRWKTPEGIGAGTALKELERMNRRPFKLAGFAFDEQGSVVSWEGGALESLSSSLVKLHIQLAPRPGQASLAVFRQVQGDRFFSSAHPAMQALNPAVWRMMMIFARESK